MRTVLFDLTILATETKVRGIGRYLSELARALGKLTAGSSTMRVRFLERADWAGDGSVSDDAEKAISRLVERPWRIIYRVEGKRVLVLAVLDSHRDLQALLLERLVRS